MAPIRVVVTGVSGRMGSLLVGMVSETNGFVLVGATDRPAAPSVGHDVGLVAKRSALGLATVDSLERVVGQADVVIDFTHAEASVGHAQTCARARKPLVVGSTGFSDEGRAALADAARSIPMVVAPNMSVGVNLVLEVARTLALGLGEAFDIEVLETHHRLKKDAPSGTALRLAEELASATGRRSQDIVTKRSGLVGERTKQEIGVQSLRGGDVVGEHTVYFFGDGERVELTHRSSSRDQYGRGALRAAKWVIGQPPGLYGMAQVLRGSAP